jgi:hypothetical protein
MEGVIHPWRVYTGIPKAVTSRQYSCKYCVDSVSFQAIFNNESNNNNEKVVIKIIERII